MRINRFATAISGVALLAGLVVAACGGSSSGSTSRSSTPATGTTMSGTWAGTSADSTGQGKVNWAVTQNGNSMTGTMTFGDTGRGMMGNGSMQGTVNGSTVSFHMSVPNGGFSGGMMSSCSMGMDGQATMSADGHTMTGTYSGSMSGMMSGEMMGQSCGGTMNNGQFTMTH